MATPYQFTGTGQLVAAAALPAGAFVVGVDIFDTSAAANTVQVCDGTSTAGPLLACVTAASGAGAHADIGHPRRVSTAIHVTTTGACRGTVWVA